MAAMAVVGVVGVVAVVGVDDEANTGIFCCPLLQALGVSGVTMTWTEFPTDCILTCISL